MSSTTIRDVAEKADVSVATVSRVLNNSNSVRETTKERVLEAAQALDYLPNETARNLRTQKTRTVGVLLPNMHGEFFAQITRGLDQRAKEDGHHVLVSNSHTDEGETESVIRSLLGRVDGLIILWPRLDIGFLENLVPDDLPIVLLSTSIGSSRFQTLSFENRSGAYAAVEHLAEHGHERVAILTGDPVNYDAQERLAGYRDAVQDLGLVADSALEIKGDFTQEGGRKAVKQLLSLDPPPSALFASNDSMALGVLRGVHEAGLQVPDDLALIGFDDIPSARFATPSLTTVRAPTLELGRRAMDALLDASASKQSTHRTLDTQLIRRESCGCSSTE
jgi:LacI family transcriptional regulator